MISVTELESTDHPGIECSMLAVTQAKGAEKRSRDCWADMRQAGPSHEVMGMRGPEQSLPPPLTLTWCVGITGAEGIRCRDSRL